jgi:hypothetical protein
MTDSSRPVRARTSWAVPRPIAQSVTERHAAPGRLIDSVNVGFLIAQVILDWPCPEVSRGCRIGRRIGTGLAVLVAL